MKGLGEVVDDLQLRVARLGKLLHVGAAIRIGRSGQSDGQKERRPQPAKSFSHHRVNLESRRPQFARTNLKKKAKARLRASFEPHPVRAQTRRGRRLNPCARCIVDAVAAGRRGDRRHSDQHRVLPHDEPGRNALGEAVDRRLGLEGLAKRGLVEEIAPLSAGRRRRASRPPVATKVTAMSPAKRATMRQ